MDWKKFSLIILAAILISVILVVFLPKTAKAPTTTPTPTPTVQKTPEICVQFEKLEKAGEISCQEAINKALSLYNGTVTEVVMANNLKKADAPPSEQGIQAWRIVILLDKPVEENGEIMTNVRVTLDRKDGSLFSQYFFK